MMEVLTRGALSICIGGVGACKCEVPSCICNKSTTIPNKLCELHQCNIGHLDCDCMPPPAFFIFPSNKGARARWISLINREDLLVNGSWLNDKDRYHVCWRHFPDGKPTVANPDPVQNLMNGSPSHNADSTEEDLFDTSTEAEKADKVNTEQDLSTDSLKNNKLKITTDTEKNNMLNRPAHLEKDNTPNALSDSERDNANVSDSAKDNTQNTSGDSAKNNTQNMSGDSAKDNTQNTSSDSAKNNTQNMSGDSERNNTQNMSGDSERNNTQNMSGDSERNNTQNMFGDSERNNTQNMSGDSERNNTQNMSGDSERNNTQNMSGDSERNNTQEKDSTQNASGDSEKDIKQNMSVTVNSEMDNTQNFSGDSERDTTSNMSADSEREGTLNIAADSSRDNTQNMSADSSRDNTQNMSADSSRDNTQNMSADSSRDNTQNMSADSSRDNTQNMSANSSRDKTQNMSANSSRDNTQNMSANSSRDNTQNMSANSSRDNTQNMSVDSEREDTFNESADWSRDNTQNMSADPEMYDALNMSADSEMDNTLNTSADSGRDDLSKSLLGKASPSYDTTPPSERVITEKRQGRVRNSRSKSVSSCEAELIEVESSESDSSSDSDDRIYCKCGKPNTDRMIGCDGKNCEFEWFHFRCIGIRNRRQVPRGKWYCDDCSKKVKDAQKEAMDLKSKLKQICKDIMTKKITLQSASETHGVSIAQINKHLYSEPILTTQEEERLVGLAVSMAKQGRGILIKPSILNNVKVLLDVEEKMGIKRLHPFEKNRPQDEWWNAFCKRHPQIRKMKLHKLSNMTLISKTKILKQNTNCAPGKKEKENQTNTPLASNQSYTPVNSMLKRSISPQTNDRNHDNGDQKNAIKKVKYSPDATHHEKSPVGANLEPNALHCLEAVLTKKQKHLFQYRFKNDIEHDDDVVYSAWRALKLLYYGTREERQDGTKKSTVPQTEGDIPPWSPWRKGPFYVPDKSSKSSVSLLIDEPGKKRQKKMMSRIVSMGVKRRRHYMEPWRFGVCNRKVFKPRKTEVKRRRRKRRVTRRFEGYF